MLFESFNYRMKQREIITHKHPLNLLSNSFDILRDYPQIGYNDIVMYHLTVLSADRNRKTTKEKERKKSNKQELIT